MAENSVVKQLRWALQALAQPADVQLRLYPDFVCKADELALDLHDALVAAGTNLDGEQLEMLGQIDGQLSSFSGKENSSRWTEQALRSDPVWEEVRTLAKRALLGLGWPCEPPPEQPSDRGATYVKGP